MRLIIALVMVAGAMAIARCATSPTGRKQFLMISDAEMNSLGSQAFGEMRRKVPVENDSRINAYVRCVADHVAREADDPTGVKSWEVVVFREKSVNAFALPGGKIGVHTGILPVAKSPDQLAAVLGHEVGHVIARHGGERMSQAFAAETLLAITQAALSQRSEGERQTIMGALGLGAQFGVLMPFGRKQESESDEIGVMLMARAGFDPRESVELWKNMAKASGGSPPEWLSTHPSHSTRIRDLQAQMPRAMVLFERARAAGKNPQCGNWK